jgi:hypothetical protein
MRTQLQNDTKVVPIVSFTPVRTDLLQRKCVCGQHTIAGGECAGCRQKHEGMIQRAAINSAPSSAVPLIVHEVLSSPGQSLDAGMRAFMEPRFGHDFSQVRVHTGDRAAESARAVNALAYTVGRDVVFGTGQYEPGTSEGRSLLAHELTHVVQQTLLPSTTRIVSDSTAEKEAQQNAAHEITPVKIAATVGMIQRQRSELDPNATSIIAIARDTKRTSAKRATDLVWYILGQYYPSEKPKVRNVIYKQNQKGLLTQAEESPSAMGVIEVGDDFVKNTDEVNFGRRVLQVGHELEHIDQHRLGMGGPKKHDQREFLAFYDEAFAKAKPGTGGVQRSMRAHLIDTAIGYYYCLGDDLKDTYKPKLQELLDQRPHEIKRGYERAKPPTSCERPKEDESAK